jgi:hypothetical protein
MERQDESRPDEQGTVEALLEQVAGLADAQTPTETFELWVPAKLTQEGRGISVKEAMEVIDDAAGANGYISDGFSQSSTGRLYKYVRQTRDTEQSEERTFATPLVWVLLFALVTGFLIIIYR